ncbi:bifunctional methylenetetrahydrofolate dehydrogenase/methenyltetrahydrofolate cyclohydrolase FolD [Bradyrhizobium sp. WSM3983]|uniref:bifunctional methylenetetrahydrofolate dehydrogenase/methenyltetrahydrofolate cyclohydrolase FolD n=1 Tax=Bradyrhizobium sp. WSM3983 TaxID=1038867 RepID=UPI0004864592|nr:bifunctional methylenetetrahydrofolate dehydrogenase/methenyltetrahydrofolate cyclohydrolase FolD [Bradyrhizobium sp. WSM3983]
MASLIDGKKIAKRLTHEVAADVIDFVEQTGTRPTLAVVLLGDDPASCVYVARKLAACREIGITSVEHRLPSTTSQFGLFSLIDQLNSDPAVHGILVQLPLPHGLDPSTILDRIDPRKDVDGFHPVNFGRLSSGTDALVPCTPLGCMMLLESVVHNFKGLHAVVIGKSNIVGKPISLLLLERACTVTITHKLTRNLPDITRSAEIVVVAAGHPELVKGNWIKANAVVVDVGISRVSGPDGRPRLVGDCARQELSHARAITPVPGGVGPMTVACLLANTVRAALKQHRAQPTLRRA